MEGGRVRPVAGQFKPFGYEKEFGLFYDCNGKPFNYNSFTLPSA